MAPPEAWTISLISAASALYILRCIPVLHGLVGILVLLLLGGLLGIALLSLTLALVVYLCTTPAVQPQVVRLALETDGSNSSALQSRPDKEDGAAQATPPATLSKDMEVHDAEHPPPAFTIHGEFSGWVWIVPASKYDVNEAVADWPPETEGPKAFAKKWFAAVKHGKMVLTQKLSLGTEDFVPVVTVMLGDCKVSIPMEGLRGKSRWWKKCPLQISNASRPLLSGEKTFFLFAASGCAKEQWFDAFKWATEAGGAPRTVEDLYSSFCSAVRAASTVPLPQVEDMSVSDDSGADDSDAEARRRKLRRGWTSMFKRNPTRKLKAPKKSKSALAMTAAPAIISPEELDRQWYEAKPGLSKLSPAASPTAADVKKVDQAARGPEHMHWQKSGTDDAAPGTSLGSRGRLEARSGELEEDVLRHISDASVPSGSRSAPRGSSPVRSQAVISSRSVELAAAAGSHGDQAHIMGNSYAQDGDPPAAADVAQPLMKGISLAAQQRALQQSERTRKEDAAKSRSKSGLGGGGARGGGKRMSSHAGGKADATAPANSSEPAVHADREEADRLAREAEEQLLPRIAIEDGVNMFVTRIAFDLLRNPTFEAATLLYIQKKLDQLRYPPYIGKLKVVGLCVGNTVPAVSNFRALPTPTPFIWPQVLADIDYQGNCWVTLETNVDLREAAAWGQFDKAMARFGGNAEDGVDAPEEGCDADDDPPDPAEATAAAGVGQEGEGGKAEAAQARRPTALTGILSVRKAAADRIRQLADMAADQVSRIPLRLRVSVTALRGTVLLWVPPPPGDRIWSTFIAAPYIEIEAKPEVGNRMIKASLHANRVSQWIETKLKGSVLKNMVYPACSDMRLPGLLAVDHEWACNPLLKVLADRAAERPQAASSESAKPATDPAALPLIGQLASMSGMASKKGMAAPTTAAVPSISMSSSNGQKEQSGEAATQPTTASAITASAPAATQPAAWRETGEPTLNRVAKSTKRRMRIQQAQATNAATPSAAAGVSQKTPDARASTVAPILEETGALTTASSSSGSLDSVNAPSAVVSEGATQSAQHSGSSGDADEVAGASNGQGGAMQPIGSSPTACAARSASAVSFQVPTQPFGPMGEGSPVTKPGSPTGKRNGWFQPPSLSFVGKKLQEDFQRRNKDLHARGQMLAGNLKKSMGRADERLRSAWKPTADAAEGSEEPPSPPPPY